MSKNKPKETIEYVIRLQDKERQLFDDAIGAYRFGRISSPIVSILKDNSALLVISGLLVLLLPNLPPGWRDALEIDGEETTIGKIKDWLELENLAGGVVGAWGGAWAGAPAGPWGALIGGLAGALSGIVAVEVGEEVGEALFDSDFQTEAEAARAGNAISGTVILMYLIITFERIGNRDTI